MERRQIGAFTVLILIAQVATAEHASLCDLETGLCGWRLGEPEEGRYAIARAPADIAPGPPADAEPGTAQGHYVYINYTGPVSENPVTLLSFPTYRYICHISLSYYTSSSLYMSLLRFNSERKFLPPYTEPTTTQWNYWSMDYSISGMDYPLMILIEEVLVGGEAEEEEEELQVAAVDNITLTFCLPCDFDILPQPGNLQLTVPSALNVSLGQITNFSFSASSPLCPSLPLMFSIDAVEPPSLVAIFSVEAETGVVVVDATGPGLLAEGALGHINVSVYVLGSNYTQTGPPHKATATILLEQDPVIRIHDTPSQLTVEVDLPFSLQIHTAHILPSTHPLTYQIHTSPLSLNSHITINTLGEITGVVTIETITDILRGGGANITVGVANQYGSYLELTIPLVFPPTPPLLLNSDLSFTVSENHTLAMANKPLSTLVLIDPNGDTVAVPYTTWEGGVFQLFPLGHSEGEVWRWEGRLFVDQTRLDFETLSSHSLNLTVADSAANSSLSTSLAIHITVTSENEHAPVFVNFRSSEMVQASVAEGTLVVPEKATDQDRGSAGEISYSISHGNEHQFFLIDKAGDVKVATSPLLPGLYSLTIVATDGGSPPLSVSGVLTVTVTAVGEVDCHSQAYGKPVIHSIGIDESHIQTPVGSDVTLYCSYQANPAVALYQWEVNPVFPPSTFSYVYPLSSPSSSSHVSLLPHQLTLIGVTAGDAAFYTCNVTNWCGSVSAVHILFVIDYPLPVRFLHSQSVQRDSSHLYPTSLHISWLPPSISSSSPTFTSPLLNISADYYLVQVSLFTGSLGNSYHSVANVSALATNFMVDGLLPGNKYYVRVASVNRAGATHSDNISVTLPPTAPKLLSVDTRQEANHSILVSWEVAYDGGSPITQFTVTISPHSPRQRTRRQEEGVVYHVDPSAGSLLTRPLETGRRYLVTVSLENSHGEQSYSLTEYVGHVESVRCDFESQQLCPWRLEGGILTDTPSGGVVEAVVYGQSSEVILRHMAAGYVCGYGFSYQLWGGAELQVRVGGGSVVWEDSGDTGDKWKQVSTSEVLDVDYLSPSLGSHLEMVVSANGSSGGVRVDGLQLDFCLPCDFSSLHLPGKFSLNYPKSVTLRHRESSEIIIQSVLAECPRAVIQVDNIRVVPGILERYVLTEVEGHNVSVSVGSIPPEVSVQTGLLQVSISVVGSDYASPPGDRLVGVAEIEFTLEEEQDDNCSDVIACMFVGGGACGWSLGEHATFTDTLTNGVAVRLAVSDSHSGGVVLSREFTGDTYCRLSFHYVAQGVELVAIVTGVGVVWTSETDIENSVDGISTANFTFDLVESSLLDERNVTLSLGSVWGGDGSVLLLSPTLYPCTPCAPPPDSDECPEPSPPVCPTVESCSHPRARDNEGSLVAAVGGLSAALVALLICCLSTVIYSLRASRNVSQKEKRWREAERLRLMADRDSIGTAGSVSRASAAGDRARWRKYGESSTLMTFVPDEEEAGGGSGRQESSWLQAVELTHTAHLDHPGVGLVRGLGSRGEVLRNPLYSEEEEEEEEEEGERVEMLTMSLNRQELPPPSPTHSSDL